MSRDVFISYKSDEYDIAYNIYKALKADGVSVWMAPQDIPGGSSYAMEITNAIKGCKIFVLVLSKAAQTSQWIPKEIDGAINAKKLILPFMVEKCDLNAEFSFLLSNIQFKDGYTNPDEALKKLIKEIKNNLGIKGTPPAAEPEKPAECTEAPATAAVPPEKIIEFVGKQLNGENPPIVKDEPKKKEPERKAYSPYEKDFDKKDAASPSDTSGAKEKTPAASSAAASSSVSSKTKKKNKKSKKKIIIAAAAVLILLAVVLIPALAGGDMFTPTITIAGSEYELDTSYLYFSEDTITGDDINSLSSFTNLSSLTFTDCIIEAPLFNQDIFFDFSSVTIKNCNISQEFYDSINLGACTNLYHLDISGNPLIESLNINEGELSRLSTLIISGTAIDNIETVYNSCPMLTHIDISDTPIRDIDFLAGNQSITTLGIANLELTTLDKLNEMIFLEELNASGNNIGTLDGISNCTLLEKVSLSDCGISDISVLGKSAAHLKEVNLKNNSISDLSPLENCTLLTTIDVTSNNITSLAPLKNSAEMKKIFASDNEITSIEGIEALALLNELDLSKNKLTKISAPLVFDNYASVYLNDNELTEIALSSENNYNKITLHNNSFSDGTYLNSINSSSITLDYTEGLSLDALQNNFLNLTIYGCPLDKQAEITNNVYGVTFAE